MIKKTIGVIILLLIGIGVINKIGGQIWVLRMFKFNDKQITKIIKMGGC